MSTLAPPVLHHSAAAVWEHTLSIQTTVGHELFGLFLPDGARVLTANVQLDAVHAGPAFLEGASNPGEWPVAIGRHTPQGALATLHLALPQPAPAGVRCVTPTTRTRAMAVVRAADGTADWTKVAFMGPVPRQSNRTTSTLYLGCLTGASAPLPPGTPLFRLEDGACVGLLVPDTAVTTRLSAPMCVIAAVEDSTGS